MNKEKFVPVSTGEQKPMIELSEYLIQEAQELLKNNKVEGAVCIPSKGGEVSAILSPNSEDLIPLSTIEHEGITYYLGIPKQ